MRARDGAQGFHSVHMTRYFFDIHDVDGVWPDEEGQELIDIEAAQVEAALSLAAAAQSESFGKPRYRTAIEVRTANGLLFRAAFIFEARQLQ